VHISRQIRFAVSLCLTVSLLLTAFEPVLARSVRCGAGSSGILPCDGCQHGCGEAGKSCCCCVQQDRVPSRNESESDGCCSKQQAATTAFEHERKARPSTCRCGQNPASETPVLPSRHLSKELLVSELLWVASFKCPDNEQQTTTAVAFRTLSLLNTPLDMQCHFCVWRI